jgi:VanZ family protein
VTRSVFGAQRRKTERVTVFGWRWIVVGGYMAAIFLASSGPGPALPSISHADKLLHAAAFGVLAGLAAWAIARGQPRAATWRMLLAAALVSAAYGALDEAHQYFVPGRQADALDLLADAIGAFAATGAIRAWGIIARGSE